MWLLEGRDVVTNPLHGLTVGLVALVPLTSGTLIVDVIATASSF